MGVRGSVGPILTTGAALVAAAVVVANPVMAPRADIRIPAVELSAGGGDALAMLDEDFLKAIAPAPPQSTGPVAVLRDLFSSLAADASYVGKNAVVSALIAGASVVADPYLTAVSTPLLPAPAAPTGAWPKPVDISPGYLPPAVVPLPDGDLADLASTVATAVTTIINDVSYGIEAQVITMAFAAGAFLAEETGHVIHTLGSLVTGDLDGALRGAAAGITAVATASVAIVDAIRTFVENGFPATPVLVKPVPASATPVDSLPIAVPDVTEDSGRRGQQRSEQLTRSTGVVAGNTTEAGSAGTVVADRGGVVAPDADAPGAETAGSDGPATDAPATDIPGADTGGADRAGGIKLGDGNKVSPSGRPGRPAAARDQAPGPLREALDAVRSAAGGALKAPRRTAE